MTEQNNEKTELTPKNNRVKKTVYAITGISDFQLIFRNVKDTKNLLKERVSFIRAQTEQLRAQGKTVSGPSEKSFEELMSTSKSTEEELIAKATRHKRYWIVAMGLSSLAMLFTGAGIVRLIVDSGFNIDLLKPFLTLILFGVVAVLAFVKCVTYEFLGWRLVNRCNSEAEEGTYPFFVGDYGLHQVFKFDQAGHVRGSYEKG